ncbi:hypothetical protein BCR39DRAFT_470833, partial [Naematelia encephala]
VGLLDRFTLMFNNIDETLAVAYLASFPDPSTSPTLESLEARIEFLQSKWPLLWALVKGADGEKPFFEARAEGHWPPKDVIDSRDYPRHDKTSSQYALELMEQHINGSVADYIRQVDSNPAWKITLLKPQIEISSAEPGEPERSNDSPRPAYLILSTNHVYFDGAGGLNFFQALLASSDSPMLTNLPVETLSAIRRIEDIVHVKTRLGVLIPIAWKELIVPALFPKRLQRYFVPTDVWPGKDVRPPLLGRHASLTAGGVDKVVMDGLKKWAKVKGSGTLHPILEITYYIAMWSRTSSRYSNTSVPSTLATRFKFQASTPKSQRNPSLGTASSTGNYLAEFERHFVFDTSSKSKFKLNFWALVKSLGEYLTSKKDLQDARSYIGLLYYMPKGVNKNHRSSSALEKGLPRTPTKWEEWLVEKCTSPEPIRNSVAVSNLGYINISSEVDEVLWGQASTFAAIEVSLLGTRTGLTWTTGFKDGVAVTKDEMERIDRLVERILIYLSKQDWTDRDDISMQSLVEECASRGTAS